MNATFTSNHTALQFTAGPFATAADVTAFASAETPPAGSIPVDTELEAAGALPMSDFTVAAAS